MMSSQPVNNPEHDEIFSMLPWYVNRTLEADQRKRVFEHIGQCDDCRCEIKFLETLNETVNDDAQDKYRMHVDVDRSLTSVMDRIDNDGQGQEMVSSGVSRLRDTLAGMFGFSTDTAFPQWGATAMAGLVVAVLGFQLYSGQSDDEYSVLSSPDTNSTSMRLSVEMSANGDQEQIRTRIQSELEQLGQSVDIQTDADGAYIIVLKESLSVSELSKLVEELESETQIERVEVIP